ncbi:DUF4404 family protein [bacterium]|nr:DUF4404 family protein [bacterium]
MNNKLEDTLASLRDEIAKLPAHDYESKERLQQLIESLEKKLEYPENSEHHQSLTDGLSDSLTYFEVSHPRITGILNDIMMALSNMGI